MSHETPLWKADEQRFVERRAQFISGQANVRLPVAKTKAWAELGYTKSGIARKMDRAESTVSGYQDDAEESMGRGALLTRTPGEIEINASL